MKREGRDYLMEKARKGHEDTQVGAVVEEEFHAVVCEQGVCEEVGSVRTEMRVKLHRRGPVVLSLTEVPCAREEEILIEEMGAVSMKELEKLDVSKVPFQNTDVRFRHDPELEAVQALNIKGKRQVEQCEYEEARQTLEEGIGRMKKVLQVRPDLEAARKLLEEVKFQVD